MSVATALAAAAVLAVVAIAAGAALGFAVLALVLAFLLLNALYTAYLKHVVILDVMVLAIGYLLRVEAGAAAVGVAVSTWLLLCTLFVAVFLGFSKRRHELLLLADRAADQRRVLSHYSPAFLDQMISVVTASTVICYALYAMAEESVQKHGRGLVYTVPFVLFGVFRYLYLTYQRPGHANPTEEVLTDPPFLVNVALWAALVLAVLYAGECGERRSVAEEAAHGGADFVDLRLRELRVERQAEHLAGRRLRGGQRETGGEQRHQRRLLVQRDGIEGRAADAGIEQVLAQPVAGGGADGELVPAPAKPPPGRRRSAGRPRRRAPRGSARRARRAGRCRARDAADAG